MSRAKAIASKRRKTSIAIETIYLSLFTDGEGRTIPFTESVDKIMKEWEQYGFLPSEVMQLPVHRRLK